MFGQQRNGWIIYFQEVLPPLDIVKVYQEKGT